MDVLRVNPRRDESTLLLRFDDLYPECRQYRANTAVPALQCISGRDCHVGRRCMETLAWRLHVLRSIFQDAALAILLFRQRDDGSGSLMGGSFWLSQDRDPKVSVYNPLSYRSLQRKSVTKYSVEHPMLRSTPPPDVAQAIPVGSQHPTNRIVTP